MIQKYFPYFPGSLLHSTLLATMSFHFLLDLALFLHIGPNRLAIPSSRYHGGLPRGGFLSLEFHSTPVQVHLLSVNLATYPAQWNFCF